MSTHLQTAGISNLSSTEHEVSTLCSENSANTKNEVFIGLYILVLLKVTMLTFGFMLKCFRGECRPENEYISLLLSPPFMPTLDGQRKQTNTLLLRLQLLDSGLSKKRRNRRQNSTIPPLAGMWKEKSETADMNGVNSYYAYYRMEDERKSRSLCGKCWRALFAVLLYSAALIRWTLKTLGWSILMTLNVLCSLQLFWIFHFPVVATDTSMRLQMVQSECGVVKWMVMPQIGLFFIPRFVTMATSR